MTTPMAGALSITVAGAPVVLLPERALWLPECATLVVADLHWGKAAAFRAARIPVPMGTTSSDLDRLSRALQATRATALLVLGDLLHSRAGRHPHTLDTIAAWRARHPAVAITLVRGNHDAHAGDPPAALAIVSVDGPHRLGPFVGVHDPAPHAEGYVLGGHLHPTVTVHGRGRQRVRLPAFVFGAAVAVLPAFSSFTGGGMYVPPPEDAVYAVAGDDVVAVRSSA